MYPWLSSARRAERRHLGAGGATLASTTTGGIVAITKAFDGSMAITAVPTSTSSTGMRRLSWRRLVAGQWQKRHKRRR